jgi:hypothetical protein
MDRLHEPATNRTTRARWLAFVTMGLLIGGCTTTLPAARTIHESPDAIVRLEPNGRIPAAGEIAHDHPVPFSEDQLEILLTSISGRNKIGLLRSFLGTPGTPRLFEPKEIEVLAPSLKEALEQAKPDEVVTFSCEHPGQEGQSTVTSGTLFVQNEILYVMIANFRHPIRRRQSDVGAIDKLEDVRETTDYVRAHPWFSVGEQDFAIFFDDPQYQRQSRRGDLFGYPERTLGIAYRPFLASNPDRAKRVEEVKQSAQQEHFGKDEAKVIADLQRRISELERSKEDLELKLKRGDTSPLPTTPAPIESTQPAFQETNQRLLEIIRRLEQRLATLEEEVRKGAPAPAR